MAYICTSWKTFIFLIPTTTFTFYMSCYCHFFVLGKMCFLHCQKCELAKIFYNLGYSLSNLSRIRIRRSFFGKPSYVHITWIYQQTLLIILSPKHVRTITCIICLYSMCRIPTVFYENFTFAGCSSVNTGSRTSFPNFRWCCHPKLVGLSLFQGGILVASFMSLKHFLFLEWQ